LVKLPNKNSSWLVSDSELGPKSTKIIKVAKLLDKKNRRKTKTFLIEGENAVEACAKSGKLVEIYCTKKFLIKKTLIEQIQKIKEIPVNLVSEKALEKITETNSPAGIVGISTSVSTYLEEADFINKKFILILFDISDPGNVGTILRSADAFGVDLIVLVGQSVDISNGKIIRSSAGSIFNLEIKTSDLKNLVNTLKSFKGNIYLTKANSKTSIDNVNLVDPLVWIFGNEAHGLRDFPENLGTDVSIPMKGKTESLNVSTAATLCMYETAKYRSSN